MMELTKIMSKRSFPHHPFCGGNWRTRTVRLRHLAELAKENWNIVAMLNNDMIGNSLSSGTNLRDNTKVRVFGEATPYLKQRTKQNAKANQ
jgi:hypothetical protein